MISLSCPAAPDDLRVWLIQVDVDAPIDYGMLSEQERARAQRYLRHADAARFTTVRAALRRILAACVDAEPSSLIIETDAKGRPKLAAFDAPDFNVSHSGAYGVIALSMKRSVGVDIEEARALLNWRELAPAVFADADHRAVHAMPEPMQRAAFFDCWSAKEAVLKAHGTGMGADAIRMDAFSVLPRETGGRFALSTEAGAFEAHALSAPLGYAASLAWSR